VVGAPLAPGSPSAAAGSAGQAVLTWTVPANNGSAIGSFTVTPYDGGTKGTPIVLAGSALTGTTVTGLISTHTYTFTVFATNGNGAGPAATTNAVTVGGRHDSADGVGFRIRRQPLIHHGRTGRLGSRRGLESAGIGDQLGGTHRVIKG
jgi:hypothetical protein